MTIKNLKNPDKEELRMLIEFCQSVKKQGINPFLVDVDDLISVIRKYFPNWDNQDDLCLDAIAINQLASIIKMQSDWIKHRATTLYRDPFLIQKKLRSLSIIKIAEIFREVWHPIVEMEQISIFSLDEALKYWNKLKPINDRWPKEELTKTGSGITTREELIQERLLLSEYFTSELEESWERLKNISNDTGKIDYWDFIGSETYNETLKRAYLTSFLVTYGYAVLEFNPLEDKVYILPFEEQRLKEDKVSFSFPISIDFKEWSSWRERQEA
jgi:hypothetical protein